MAKSCLEGECLDTGSVPEDSDCEDGLDHASESAPGGRVNRKNESERKSFPVLTIGSFVRYVQHHVVARSDSFTLLVVGGHCSSICAQARYSLHHFDPKVQMRVHNMYKGRQLQTNLLHVLPK